MPAHDRSRARLAFAILLAALAQVILACEAPVVPSAPGATAPPTAQPTPTPTAMPTISTGWLITTYYTAVESFHSGTAVTVSGCLNLGCSAHGTIGAYPADFAQAVKDEGTGRITAGAHAGKYLNWSYDVGYWLDSAPRDSHGGVLVPFVSAAADSDVLMRGTAFRITGCGNDGSGHPTNATACAKFQASRWRVSDQFTPGYGGQNHLDLYLGEEDRPNFTGTTPYWLSAWDVALATD